MKRPHLVLSASSVCLLASSAYASTVKISVLNEANFGQAGAKVTLVPTGAPPAPGLFKKVLNDIIGASNGPKTFNATTDAYGAAKFQGVPAGNFTINFTAKGYPNYTGQLAIDDATAEYKYSGYLKTPPNPGTVSFQPKILSTVSVLPKNLGKYEKSFRPGTLPELTKICARNSASHDYAGRISLGGHIFAPNELVETYFTCDTAADGKTLAPKFRADFSAVSGENDATYENGSSTPTKLSVRSSPQLTKITRTVPSATAYSFNIVEGKTTTVYFKDQSSNFYFGFDPSHCDGKDGKPETDPAKLAAHECDGGYDRTGSDGMANAFPEDVVTKATDATGTENAYVRYQAKEVWFIAELDDGSQAGQPAKDGTIIAQKYVFWLSGKSGTPIIYTNHFSTVVPVDRMAEAVAVQQILDKDPTAVQNLGAALVNAYNQADAAGADQDPNSQAPYLSGSYVRLGAKTAAAFAALGLDQSESNFAPDSQGNLVDTVNDGYQWQGQIGLNLGYLMDSPTNNPISWQDAMIPVGGDYQLIRQIAQGGTSVQTTMRFGAGGPTGTFPAALAEVESKASTMASTSLTADQVTSIQKTAETAIEQAAQQ